LRGRNSPSARTRGRASEGVRGRARGREVGMHRRVCTDASARPSVRADASVRTHRPVRPDTSVLSPSNYITDAIVRPSYRRPIVRPSVRPSTMVYVTTTGTSGLLVVN
jgi:hypothetical protein